MSDSGRSVALLHYTAPPVVGGVERVLARHAILMADAGHDVRVVAGRGESPDPRVAFYRIPLMDTGNESIAQLQSGLAGGSVPPDFARAVAELRDALAGALEGVDVAIAHNLCSLGLNLALTAALRELLDRWPGPGRSPRLIAWHHDLAWTSASYRDSMQDRWPWTLLREPWPGTVQVVVSEARRAELAALSGLQPEAIAVVPNGLHVPGLLRLEPRSATLLREVDLGGPDRIPPDRTPLDPLLLMPARITPRKNIELAVRVVAAMHAMARPAGLIVTGPVDPHRPAESALVERILDLRRSLGLESAVRLLAAEPEGPPTDAVMADLYRLADALFLPSRDEGFGLPVLEAAAHRLPIICADLPTLRELAGDGATYISIDDPPETIAARVLERLDADGAVRLARRIRRDYSWEAIYRDRIAPLLADC